MYIERIELQNVKSYGFTPTIIEFGAGVNLISGMNGAGKSTILEAIGFALFDALPYKQTDFVRRGKSGKSRVVVRIRSSYDDRRYDIERTVNPSNFAIYDVNENFKESLESKDEALEWLKQHLKIEQTTDLESLFNNAVGMQQGTITSVFLETPKTRKATFDALLRVEDYDDAWTNLRETENYIKELIADNDKKFAVAENTIETLKNKPQEAQILEDEIESDEQELTRVRDKVAELEAELKELDDLSKKASKRKQLQKELEQAQTGYDKQENKIVELTPQVEERSELADEVSELENEREKLDERIKQHESTRSELEETHQRAKDAFNVAEEERTKLQGTKKELERLHEEHAQAIERKAQIEAELSRRAELTDLIEQTDAKLNEATKQQTEAKALISTNGEKLQELQRMRELLGEEGVKCPVCRQEMHGPAHAEAIKYYDEEERKVNHQNADAQTQLENTKATIKHEKQTKKNYQDEQNSLSNAKALEDIDERIEDYDQQIEEKQSELEQMVEAESLYHEAEDALANAKKTLDEHDDEAKTLSEERKKLVDKISKLNKQIADLPSQKVLDDEQYRLDDFAATINEKEQALANLDALPDYDEKGHEQVKKAHQEAVQKQSSLTTKIGLNNNNLLKLGEDIAKLRDAEQKQDELQAKATTLEKHQVMFTFVRKTVREAGPRIRERKVRLVSEVASNYFNEIISDYTMRLQWNADDYGIAIEQGGEERPFQVLSGGEQMIAALSVRLALLTHLTKIRLIFLDEPTINLDDNRRVMLSTQLSKIRDLQQLFVISHDDTFVEESNHVIAVTKVDDVSTVEVM